MTSPKEIAQRIRLLFQIPSAYDKQNGLPLSLYDGTLESLISEALEEQKNQDGERITELVKDAYEQAKDDALLEYIKDNHIPHEMIRKEVKAEAYEECARIAESARYAAGSSTMGYLTACEIISEKIRQRAETLKGETQ